MCVILSVCQSACLSVRHDTTKTAESTITKLATGRSPSPVLATKGQKVKGQGHRVTKCKNILKALEWPAWVMHSIECPASMSLNQLAATQYDTYLHHHWEAEIVSRVSDRGDDANYNVAYYSSTQLRNHSVLCGHKQLITKVPTLMASVFEVTHILWRFLKLAPWFSAHHILSLFHSYISCVLWL